MHVFRKAEPFHPETEPDGCKCYGKPGQNAPVETTSFFIGKRDEAVTACIRCQKVHPDNAHGHEDGRHCEHHHGCLVCRLQTGTNEQIHSCAHGEEQTDADDHQQRTQVQVNDLVSTLVDITLVHARKLLAAPPGQKHGGSDASNQCNYDAEKGGRNPLQALAFTVSCKSVPHGRADHWNALDDGFQSIAGPYRFIGKAINRFEKLAAFSLVRQIIGFVNLLC